MIVMEKETLSPIAMTLGEKESAVMVKYPESDVGNAM